MRTQFPEAPSLLKAQINFIRAVVGGNPPVRQEYLCGVCGDSFKKYTRPKSTRVVPVVCDECHAELQRTK